MFVSAKSGLTATILCLAIALGLPGCGGSKVKHDTSAFNDSIVRYLAEKNMDMKVSEFKSLEVTGDTASAVCSIKHASSIGPSVRWTFSFVKEGDSWTVSAHAQ